MKNLLFDAYFDAQYTNDMNLIDSFNRGPQN